MNMTIDQLITYVAASSDKSPRTSALEQEIEIGTGFHNKWYRSQREHFLGWLVFQQCEANRKGLTPEQRLAKSMWNRLKCSPMMFWLAEEAGVESEALDEARRQAILATQENPKDGNPHGRFIRSALPWEKVESAFTQNVSPADPFATQQAADEAFDRLKSKKSKYRKLEQFRNQRAL